MFVRSKAFFALLLAGCSAQNLDKAELNVDVRRDVTLQQLSDTAGNLSRAYVVAAKRTKTTQDVFSFLVFTSAATAVSGVVANAPKKEIAAAAIVGTAAQQGGARLAPKAAIDSIFDGAKRMNCISAVAALGQLTLVTDANAEAGVIATRWAIDHVRILTREKLTQEADTFSGMFGEFEESVKDATGATINSRVLTKGAIAVAERGAEPDEKFKAFLALLDKCTNNQPVPLSTTPPAKPASG